MFAGFDFKIDSQENLINFSDYVIQGKIILIAQKQMLSVISKKL